MSAAKAPIAELTITTQQIVNDVATYFGSLHKQADVIVVAATGPLVHALLTSSYPGLM